MQDKMKKIFQYLLIVYVVFGITQATNKYHVANLLYKEDAKILTEFNRWSKFEENKLEIEKILKDEEETKKESSTPKFVSVKKEDKVLKTSDGKYTYEQVRQYHEDVKGFNKLNNFIFNMNTLNLAIVLYFIIKFFRRRGF
jgi:hypothetical protein